MLEHSTPPIEAASHPPTLDHDFGAIHIPLQQIGLTRGHSARADATTTIKPKLLSLSCTQQIKQ